MYLLEFCVLLAKTHISVTVNVKIIIWINNKNVIPCIAMTEATIPAKGDASVAKQPEKLFTIKKWNAVAVWSWDVECDTCAICRVQIMGRYLFILFDQWKVCTNFAPTSSASRFELKYRDSNWKYRIRIENIAIRNKISRFELKYRDSNQNIAIRIKISRFKCEMSRFELKISRFRLSNSRINWL